MAQLFAQEITQGLDFKELPSPKTYDESINHAPHRKQILNKTEKKLALKNALRYFPSEIHSILAPEFKKELDTYGRIYMNRFRPDVEIKARNINE